VKESKQLEQEKDNGVVARQPDKHTIAVYKTPRGRVLHVILLKILLRKKSLL
jgi:hypothetical protein